LNRANALQAIHCADFKELFDLMVSERAALEDMYMYNTQTKTINLFHQYREIAAPRRIARLMKIFFDE
jgi:hypothetical protein